MLTLINNERDEERRVCGCRDAQTAWFIDRASCSGAFCTIRRKKHTATQRSSETHHPGPWWSIYTEYTHTQHHSGEITAFKRISKIAQTISEVLVIMQGDLVIMQGDLPCNNTPGMGVCQSLLLHICVSCCIASSTLCAAGSCWAALIQKHIQENCTLHIENWQFFISLNEINQLYLCPHVNLIFNTWSMRRSDGHFSVPLYQCHLYINKHIRTVRPRGRSYTLTTTHIHADKNTTQVRKQ